MVPKYDFLHMSFTQIIGEAERSLHDALCVLTSTVKEPRTLYGGGCSEMVSRPAHYSTLHTLVHPARTHLRVVACSLISGDLPNLGDFRK